MRTALFFIAYFSMLAFYLVVEIHRRTPRQVAGKMILVALYLSCALYLAFSRGIAGQEVRKEILMALLFCAAGDIVLIWHFIAGGALFAIGNIFLILADFLYLKEREMLVEEELRLGILVYISCFLFLVWVMVGHQEIGSVDKLLGLAYLSTVTFHGSLGAVLAMHAPDLLGKLVGIGSILFMASDYFLGFHETIRKESSRILRLNSLTYFTGIVLIAYSFAA